MQTDRFCNVGSTSSLQNILGTSDIIDEYLDTVLRTFNRVFERAGVCERSAEL